LFCLPSFCAQYNLWLQTWPTCGLVTTANDRTIDLINRIREDKVDTTRQTPPVVGEFLIHERRLFCIGTTTQANTWSLTVLAWCNHSHKYMIAHCSGLAQSLK
jgi:hypothetical protein